MTETWVSVKNFEGLYEVSNLGRVKSCARVVKDSRTGTRTKKEKQLSLTQDSAGYLRVTLYKQSGVGLYKEVWKVHRLVAIHFCPKIPEYEVVNHINNIKTDNVSTNLEWTTTAGNNLHMVNQGRDVQLRGEDNTTSKITSEDVKAIRQMSSEGIPQSKIAKAFGISQQQVSKIVNRLRWEHLP